MQRDGSQMAEAAAAPSVGDAAAAVPLFKHIGASIGAAAAAAMPLLPLPVMVEVSATPPLAPVSATNFAQVTSLPTPTPKLAD